MDKDDWQERGKGHRERLRLKFLDGGFDRFSDEEAIEFLLTLGTPRKDVKLIAREALKQFGSLAGVLSAPLGAAHPGPGDRSEKWSLPHFHPPGGRTLPQGTGLSEDPL